MAEGGGNEGAAQPAASDLEGGSYEVIRARMAEQAKELGTRAEALNKQRIAEFGGTELAVVGNERVRTENNCLPVDIVQVGGRLLVGYNVFIGLKAETAAGDVFSLHTFAQDGDAWDLSQQPLAAGGANFFESAPFVEHFRELFRYYKEAKLVQLVRSETKLLAVFQTGRELGDIRVFRWNVDAKGNPTYVDNRGERDFQFPPQHDFEWTATRREDHVQGQFPHISILDQVFVETTGGDLTIKVENNTATGQGIYSEPVDDPSQSLDDASFAWAKIGPLVLLRIRPYREERWRHLVFSTRTREVVRVDAIGAACVSLPEDHGIVFPGGYFLQDGQYKVFDGDYAGFEFHRALRSPNGEDVLFVFRNRAQGQYALLAYNLIRREVATPIRCSGYSLFDDGKMMVFRSSSVEPTRVHPMQIWQTPFCSVEHAAKAPSSPGFLGKIGNAELVRGISDALSIRRYVLEQKPSRKVFEDLVANCTRVLDAYHWLRSAEVGDLAAVITAVRQAAELVIDEFEKVLAIRAQAEKALAAAAAAQEEIVRSLRPESWTRVDEYMDGLTRLRTQRGQLITLREQRYIDVARLDALEKEAAGHFDALGKSTVAFLLRPDALGPLAKQLDELFARGGKAEKTTDLAPLLENLAKVGEGLAALSEVAQNLQVDDPTARTRILEQIGDVLAHNNRVRATLDGRRKELLGVEGRAEFGAQFKLLGQAVTSAIGMADTAERCDEQLSRLMVQLEELEARFADFDEFASELTEKRAEIYDAFGQKKQQLLDERARRAANLWQAAERILQGIDRRARAFKDAAELNAYFASDPMVLKLRELAERMLELGDTVKSDEVQSRLKSARQDALRGLRDRLDLFEEGTQIIKLGPYRFTVNTQPLELSLVPHGDAMAVSLSGTDFVEPVADAELEAARAYWTQQLVSETAEVYRGEYLAATILFDAEAGRHGLSLAGLHAAERETGGLAEVVRKIAAERYHEGYERGVHDADATAILAKLLVLYRSAGLLRHAPTARALACLWWARHEDPRKRGWHRRAGSIGRLRGALGRTAEADRLAAEMAEAIAAFVSEREIDLAPSLAVTAGRYLVDELAAERPRFVVGADAVALRDALVRHLDSLDARRALEDDMHALEADPAAAFSLARAWIVAFVDASADASLQALGHAQAEAAVLLCTERALDREPSAALTGAEIGELLGQHPRVVSRKLSLRIDEFLERLGAFIRERVPGYQRYREVRQAILDRQRKRLRIDEFAPRVLTSFVRNRLIDEVYLPLVGANLAKQLGAAGEGKRTDLMGMLLLVSPPGYGKTTLMEYVASRLGLAFVKVNGPALGHAVTSLDPEDAPNATARQEVDKINLALEMGNNAMLYLDDIQHTNPELLQKFISLCDAQRRIEGVWNGRTRTYDLRGKKFCVVMAGNPYTESGEKFKIPDMLANRADTYNLGDILAGKDELFALSYIENAITSNPAIAPLATRDMNDLYKLVRLAQGEEVPTSDLSHGYSAVEVGEITAVLQRLFVVQRLLLEVNRLYIASASMDDKFRVEPSFKLQGSYRNMNKLAEKVVAALNDDELQRLIDDHYGSESQTLTTGAEHNLLKLAELRGRATAEQTARWEQIKRDFLRVKVAGGAEDDPVARVTGSIGVLGERLEKIEQAVSKGAGVGDRLVELQKSVSGMSIAVREAAARPDGQNKLGEILHEYLRRLEDTLQTLARPQLDVRVHNQAPPGVEELLAQQVAIIERTLVPLVRTTNAHLVNPQALDHHVLELIELLKDIELRMRGGEGTGLPTAPPAWRGRVAASPGPGETQESPIVPPEPGGYSQDGSGG